MIAHKTTAALAQILMSCYVWETKAERDDKMAEQVVIDQLQASIPDHAPPSRLMIAYEPYGRLAQAWWHLLMKSPLCTVLSLRF